MNEGISESGLWMVRASFILVTFRVNAQNIFDKAETIRTEERIVAVRDPVVGELVFSVQGIYCVKEILRPLDPEIDFEEVLRLVTENVV